MDINILLFGIMALISLAGIGSRFIPGFKSDNKIEEVAEKVIKEGPRRDTPADTPDADKGKKAHKQNNPEQNNSETDKNVAKKLLKDKELY